MMDPTQTIVATIIERYGATGAIIVALGAAVVLLWRALDKRTQAHLDALGKCHEQNLEIVKAQTKSQSELAISLSGLRDVVNAALDAVGKR